MNGNPRIREGVLKRNIELADARTMELKIEGQASIATVR